MHAPSTRAPRTHVYVHVPVRPHVHTCTHTHTHTHSHAHTHTLTHALPWMTPAHRSKSTARKEGLTGVEFSDVAGIGPILTEVMEVVEVSCCCFVRLLRAPGPVLLWCCRTQPHPHGHCRGMMEVSSCPGLPCCMAPVLKASLPQGCPSCAALVMCKPLLATVSLHGSQHAGGLGPGSPPFSHCVHPPALCLLPTHAQSLKAPRTIAHGKHNIPCEALVSYPTLIPAGRCARPHSPYPDSLSP